MSYQPFMFTFPTRIYFGVGESAKTAEYAAESGIKKAFVCTYRDVRLKALDQLLVGLRERGIPYYLHDKCEANPRAEQIDGAAESFRLAGCDFVLGVGGGSVIDTCKAVALLGANPNEGGIWAYVSGEKTPEHPAYPIGLAVTIASTGSESNESFVITDREGKQKMICNHPSVRPLFSVCDPALSVTLPPRQTALGAADILSHVLEQYLDTDAHVEISDGLSLGVLKAVVHYAPIALREPENLDARSNLMWASILAMSRLLGVGHSENWLCHMLEHALSAKYDIPHGAGMTALFPTYLAYIEKDAPAEKMEALKALFHSDTAAAGLRDFFKSLNLPVTVKEAVGFAPSAQDIKELAQNALPWGPMEAGGFASFGTEEAEELFRKAL